MPKQFLRGPFQRRSDAEGVSVDEIVKVSGEEPSIFKQTSAGLDWYGNQQGGPHLRASGWHDPEPVGEQLYVDGLLRFGSIVGHSDSDPQDTATKSQNMEPGTRLLFTQNSFGYLSKLQGFVGDNVNDRTWACDLNENISGADRTSITVTSVPYSLSDGETIWIQTGDPSNPPLLDSDVVECQVNGSVAQGDTTIPIDDGNGNPVTITASSGDRILTDHQSPWIDHATAELKSEWQSWLATFKNNGGVADGVVMDSEGAELPLNTYVKNDPRWDDASEGINGTSLKTLNSNADSWNQEVAGVLLANGWEEAIYQPIDNKFPGASCCQYNWNGMSKSEAGIGPNSDGKRIYHPKVGTHGSQPQYASMRNITNNTSSYPDNYDKHQRPLSATAFEVVQYETQRVRALWRSNSGKIQPWFTYPSLSDSFFFTQTKNTYAPYYWEYLYHMMMAHGEADVPALFFNPNNGTQEPAPGFEKAADTVFDEALREVNGKARGTSWSLHTTGQFSWDQDVVASAMQVGNRLVWRITVKRVDPQDSRDVTVNVSNGDTLTVSGGGGKNSAGVWYETGLNATPTFTTTHSPVNNDIPDDSWNNFAGSNYFFGGTDWGVQTGYSDPDGGNDAYKIDSSGKLNFWSEPIQLDPNSRYTFSVWLDAISGSPSFRFYPSDNGTDQSGRLARFDVKNVPGGGGNWRRIEIPLIDTDSTGYVRLFIGGNYRDVGLYKPMFNKGEWAGPYELPSAQ